MKMDLYLAEAFVYIKALQDKVAKLEAREKEQDEIIKAIVKLTVGGVETAEDGLEARKAALKALT